MVSSLVFQKQGVHSTSLPSRAGLGLFTPLSSSSSRSLRTSVLSPEVSPYSLCSSVTLATYLSTRTKDHQHSSPLSQSEHSVELLEAKLREQILPRGSACVWAPVWRGPGASRSRGAPRNAAALPLSPSSPPRLALGRVAGGSFLVGSRPSLSSSRSRGARGWQGAAGGRELGLRAWGVSGGSRGLPLMPAPGGLCRERRGGTGGRGPAALPCCFPYGPVG